MTRRSDRRAQAPGLGLALGAALGVVLGILIGGGAQIAFGMVIGAALGLIIGAVVQAKGPRIATGSRPAPSRLKRDSAISSVVAAARGDAGRPPLATRVLSGVPSSYGYCSPVRRPAPGRMPA